VRDRATQGLQHALCHLAAVLPVGQVLAQHDELVASEPGDGVLRADSGRQPLGDGAEHLVAHGVPPGVVDGFEAVEVDIEHGEPPGLPAGPGQSHGEPVDEQHPVG
jgi:hypothetical protein